MKDRHCFGCWHFPICDIIRDAKRYCKNADEVDLFLKFESECCDFYEPDERRRNELVVQTKAKGSA